MAFPDRRTANILVQFCSRIVARRQKPLIARLAYFFRRTVWPTDLPFLPPGLERAQRRRERHDAFDPTETERGFQSYDLRRTQTECVSNGSDRMHRAVWTRAWRRVSVRTCGGLDSCNSGVVAVPALALPGVPAIFCEHVRIDCLRPLSLYCGCAGGKLLWERLVLRRGVG